VLMLINREQSGGQPVGQNGSQATRPATPTSQIPPR
jgi:hypothetical protein